MDNYGERRNYPNKAAASQRRKACAEHHVGCMQINLMHHKKAFPSIEAAFDPAINVAYGAKYLAVLHRETSSWFTAVKRYHSGTSQVPPPLSRAGLPDLAKHQNQTPGTARASSDKRVDARQRIDAGRDRSIRQPPGKFGIEKSPAQIVALRV